MVGQGGDQALRRSAFQEAIAHLGRAIAMADKVGGGKAAGGPGQRQRLHAAYGNALMAAKGYGAQETMEAFGKARGDMDAPERLAADFGLWAASYVRGELPAVRLGAAVFLGDVGARPNSPEAGVAHRVAGTTGAGLGFGESNLDEPVEDQDVLLAPKFGPRRMSASPPPPGSLWALAKPSRKTPSACHSGSSC